MNIAPAESTSHRKVSPLSTDQYSATGVCGDPHFAAPGGIFFDWHGERDQVFSIISDTNFQVRVAEPSLRQGLCQDRHQRCHLFSILRLGNML